MCIMNLSWWVNFYGSSGINIMNKKTAISKSDRTILKLKILAKEKEAIRRELVITAKQLAKTAKEKESVRRNLVLMAKEREDTRERLVLTAKRLAATAKGRESVRRKLVITARKLRLKARQLAIIAKEKEHIRRKLAVVAEKLGLKAEELAMTIVEKKAILASIGDAVMACDKKGLVMLFNRKAVEMTGFSAKDVIGKHYNHVVKFVGEIDNKPSKDFIAEAMKTGQKTTMADNTLLIRKDGSRIPVADSAEPIRYTQGVLIGCVVVFRDITQEKEIDKAKSEFISIASHQLKTPATIISLYTEMLLSGSGGVTTLKQKEYINEVRGANQRIVDIVNTLLNISRIEMGIFSMNRVPVDIIAFLQNSIQELQAGLKEKNIVLEQSYHRSKHILSIDKLLLAMVFSNLLSNAIKYSSASGIVSVKTSEVKKDEKVNNKIIQENSLLISVSDNGCGIPIDAQDKIFTKFFRSDNARSKYTDGTGLGLYIVKSILDHMGGDVWFWSKEKTGTIFYFTIPLNRAKQKKGTRP